LAAPDPTPILFLLGAALVLLWAADYGQASLIIAGVLVAPFVLVQFTRSRILAAGTLIAATALARFSIEIGGLKAYPEHIAVGGLVILALYWIKTSSFRPTWILADSLLLAFVLSSVASSLLGSPAPGQTLRWGIQQLLVILPYFVLRLLVVDRSALQRVFKILLIVGTLEAAYTVICFFSGVIFGTSFGMEKEAYGAIAAPFGTQREPNIVGAYCGATMIMLVVVYLNRPSKKLLGAIALTAAAVMLSLSRGALASVLLAMIVVFVYGMRAETVRKRTLLKAGLAILAAWLAVAPAIASLYQERLKSVTVTDIGEDETVAGRLIVNALALEDVLEHPFLGTGTASFNLTLIDKQLSEQFEGVWIGNVELRLLHDYGAIGLAILVSFLFFLLRGSVKLLKRERRLELVALLMGGIVYCISFQATEGTLLAFSWVHLGLIGCAVAISRGWIERNFPGNALQQNASR
jgi:O-antigen ligase